MLQSVRQANSGMHDVREHPPQIGAATKIAKRWQRRVLMLTRRPSLCLSFYAKVCALIRLPNLFAGI